MTAPNGPEAGVWVIAETDDLPTLFRKIVVTDDRGRYVLPDLPEAAYAVWVRGDGLVDDSSKVTARLEGTGEQIRLGVPYPMGGFFAQFQIRPDPLAKSVMGYLLLRAVVAVSMLLAGGPAFGQTPGSSYDGPVPRAPETVARDGERIAVRAVRLAEPLRVDGQLDEALYRDARPASDFVQMEPDYGAPATEKTEVWVSFDADRIHVSIRAWESDPDGVIATEMRRDNQNIQQNDQIAFIFDTFYDRRNGVMFTVNPAAGRADGQTTNEQLYSGDWNPVWEVRTGRFEEGWTVEAAIPFKSLRYRPGQAQLWGFNVRRLNRGKNESSFLVPVPQGRGLRGILQVSQAATLVGLEVPPGSRNLELKPYLIGDLTTDLTAGRTIRNDPDADFGVDLKYGITQNITLDLTYNTDFAQVEADEQQVNLTRFNLFFPEKREFFLENAGLFTFGGVTSGGFGPEQSDAPILFYSRRIGLEQGRAVPILGGGRLTGRVGRVSVGALNVVSGNDEMIGVEPTSFSVLRVRTDILRRSSVGALFTGRWDGEAGLPGNQVHGVDGTFAFYQNLTINAYWARARTPGIERDDTSYRARLEYAADRYGVTLERLLVGDNFMPGVGFVRRDDMASNQAALRFSPRPDSRLIRRYSLEAQHTYIENGRGQLETRNNRLQANVEFHSSDRIGIAFEDEHEFVPRPFRMASNVTVPVGAYDFNTVSLFVGAGQQRRLSAMMMVDHGGFYSGERTGVTIRGARVNVSNRLALEPSYSLNRVDLREGRFTSHLAGSRVVYTVSPLMFVSALLQYHSAINALSTNVRLRWEYQPGSELFVVYNDERDTLARSFPALQNRALVVKINRLFRF